MNIRNRLKLIGGIGFVLALLGALVLYMNYSLSHVHSTNAMLLSDSYTVGTDYSGVITKQYVHTGDHVAAGQKLFVIKSSLLSSDIANQSLNKTNSAFSVDDDNNIVLKSTGSGTVADVAYLEGSFVPANKEIATIRIDNSVYVEANFKLAPPDYARLHSGDEVTVTLPNNQHISASVFNITVQNTDGVVQTVVKARLHGIGTGTTFSDGTPVNAELHLDGKNLYNSLREGLSKLIQPKG